MARGKVSDSIAWVERNNIQDKDTYQNVEILGKNLNEYTENELSDLSNKGHITLRSFTDFEGIYFTDSDTADESGSDLSFIETNLIKHKIERNLRVVYLPDLSSPSLIKKDGTLAPAMIAYFKAKGENILQSLENNLEISQYQINITPTQNLLSTGKLIIDVIIIPMGVTRKIKINLAFATNF